MRVAREHTDDRTEATRAVKRRYTQADTAKLVGWLVTDPGGYLARRAGREPRPDRMISYELRVEGGRYILTDYGGQTSILRFLWPSGRIEWLAENLLTDDVLAMVAAGVRTEAAADAFLKPSDT